MDGLIELGRMAVFYIPSNKLQQYPEIASELQLFLLQNYAGFTKTTQNINGFYKIGGTIFEDDHVRYEVSFPGENRTHEFVQFLRDICARLDEESLYLTMGQHSYLVQGTKPDE